MAMLAGLRRHFREDRVFGILILTFLSVAFFSSVFSYENFETIKYSLLLVLCGWAGLTFLSKVYSQQSKNLKINKVISWGCAFALGLALLSSLFSIDKLFSFFGTYYRFTGSFLFILTVVIFLFLLLQTLNQERFVFLAKVLVFDALIIALVGIFQSLGLGYYEVSAPSGFIRAPSLLGNPNFSTMFLVGVLPFVWALALTAKNFKARLYYALACFFIVAGSLLLSSRGALLGLVSGGVCFVCLAYWFSPGRNLKKRWFLLAFLLLIVLGMVLPLIRPNSLASAMDFNDANVKLRFQVWAMAVKQVRAHPIFGSGPGTFHMAFERARGFELAGENGLFDDAHNLFLQLAATFGLPFLALFLFLIFTAVKLGLRQLRGSNDWTVIANISGLAAFLVAASFNPVTIPCYLLLVFLLSGLVYNRQQQEVLIKKSFSIPARVLSGVLIIFGFLLYSSEQIFYFAYQFYYLNKYQSSYKLSLASHYLNPTNQLFNIYVVGNEIKLNKPAAKINQTITGLVALHPSQAKSYVYAANLYYSWYNTTKQKQHLQQAIENLQKALNIDPLFSERYAQLALYYYQLGDLNSAEKNARYGLALNDSHLPSWILLAKIYQIKNNRLKTVEAIKKAYSINNEPPELRVLMYMAKHEPDLKKIPIQILVAPSTLE